MQRNWSLIRLPPHNALTSEDGLRGYSWLSACKAVHASLIRWDPCRRRRDRRGATHVLTHQLQHDPRLIRHSPGVLLHGLCDVCLSALWIATTQLGKPRLISHLVWMKRQAQQLRYHSVVVGDGHESVPDWSRALAAGKAWHGRKVVVTDPNARGKRAGEPEP